MNCIDGLKQLDDNSIDLVCTDPPYAMIGGHYKEDKTNGGGFMGKKWDSQLPPLEVWQECYRVLKPGSWINVMTSPRMDLQWRMASRLEEAGFAVNYTPIVWAYASGFPKALNIKNKILKDMNRLLAKKYNLNPDEIEWE